jgi:hypothetical protein
VLIGSDTAGVLTGNSNTILGYAIATIGDGSISSTVVLGRQSSVLATGGIAIGAPAVSAEGVSIGYQAGDAQGAVDTDNVFIGYRSGTTANGTATNNTCVGDLSCDGLTTLSEPTLIFL